MADSIASNAPDDAAAPALPFVILASRSPRRRHLLELMGARFVARPSHVDEVHHPGEPPDAMVERLSLEKALATDHPEAGVVLGSDTVVVLDDEILGKPADTEEAMSMLRRLSGNTHTVFTGFALVDTRTARRTVGHELTRVTFRALSEEEIRHYVRGGSPFDKAGSYGIQDDFGAVFIERIDGDYYTVVGLPLARVYTELRAMAEGRS